MTAVAGLNREADLRQDTVASAVPLESAKHQRT